METKIKNRELELAGLFDKDSDYDGMLGKAIETAHNNILKDIINQITKE